MNNEDYSNQLERKALIFAVKGRLKLFISKQELIFAELLKYCSDNIELDLYKQDLLDEAEELLCLHKERLELMCQNLTVDEVISDSEKKMIREKEGE